MVFGFLDESGDPAPEGGSKWFVVVILATEHPRLVAQQVKRMRRALGKRAPGELKARFTAPRVVERFMKMLESVVRNTIADISGQVVLIEMIDSTSRLELQAVDFVAWAFWQKYERGDDRFARLLAARVRVEDVLK